VIVPTPEVIARAGALDALATLRQLQGARVLLVSDPGLVAAGHVDRARALLEATAREVRTHTEVHPEPTSDDVQACLAAAQGADALVALGGGSVLDVAKLAALMTPGERVADHLGVHDTERSDTALVLVPTTAGTGSDGQAAAIVRDGATLRKMACLAPGLGGDVVLLDAALTVSCPRGVTAAAGLDTLTHAVEVAVTTRRNARSDALATRAFVAAQGALTRVLAAPGDLSAREAMLRAAHDAGQAIAHSMLGAAHAAGNALTARYGLAHGLAVGAMLPAVVRHNARDPQTAARYAALADAAGLGASAEALIERLDALLDLAGGSAALVAPADIDGLAAEAASQWTGTFNPRPMDEAAYRALFEAVAGGSR
jgi:alcohol dehydrogenase